MTVNFQGYVFDDVGAAVSGATVRLFATGETSAAHTAVATDTTDSNGHWNFATAADAPTQYDVEISKSGSYRRIRWDDQIQLKEIDVQNNTGNTTPAATFTNFTNNADNDVAHFRSLRGTGVNNDEMFIRYYMDDGGGTAEEVARMTVKLNDATAGSGDSQITWGVLKNNAIVDALTISSSSSASLSIDFNQDAITFGTATDGTDISLTFDGHAGDGVITWMEDEDYFQFSDDILMSTTERINLRDDAIYIYSSADGQLDLVADTEIQIAATTVDINGAVDISGDLTLSGGADGALQFTNAGENSIKIPDNQASALIIEQANNAYITFVTTDSSEAITVAKATTFSAGIADAGTIAAGTWNGTDIGVAYGGTGASSLTDGGVLLGSGTGAITAMSVLTDGQMIVGDGSGDPVAESGSVLRTSIGVGTSDNVEFAAITGTTIEASTNFTMGTTVITDDSIVMTPSTDDTVTIAAATNGVLNITTVDTAAAAANLNVTIDGAITLDAAGNIELDSASGIWIFEDGGTEVLRFTEGSSGDVTVKLAVDGKDLVFTDNGDATGLTIKDAAAGIVVPGEVMTTKISYTDGDDAITIADGGGTTFAAAVDLGSNTLTTTGSLQVRTIDYSDGDNAITIADGGGVTLAQATTFSAGAVLSGDSSIQLDSTPGDEDVSGITAIFTAGEDLERGEVVYFKAGDSKMWKAVATATGTMPVVAMAAADISADATGVFLLHGFLEDNSTFPAYTVGGKLYAPEVETSSQNVPEQAAPDTDGDFVQVLGFAVTANLVYFNPSLDIIEHA